jgi:hypothetical protein
MADLALYFRRRRLSPAWFEHPQDGGSFAPFKARIVETRQG